MNERIETLLSELRRHGVLTAREMQNVIGASAATLSRLLAGPDASGIVRMGRARATRYALQRDMRGLGSCWPLYAIGDDGAAIVVGRLHALAGGSWLLQQDTAWRSLVGNEFADGLYPGLPWFLQDLRPRGFLGRLIAQRCAHELGLPSDPRDWRDDDIVHFLLARGHDMPGAFVLGRRALTVAQSAMGDGDLVAEQDRATRYPVLAAATMGGDIPGSSAAGEQPKFTTRVRRADGRTDSVIVKFSGAAGRPEDERWRDLLIAENLANSVLTEAGVPCAATEVFQAGGRCFLESSRFDRMGEDGRRGFVSLEAFDSAFFGQLNRSWDEASEGYARAGWLSREDADRLSLLWWFGTLIGNTDMHYGNAGVYLRETRPVELAPTYDMVPMLYRPDVEGRLPNEMLMVSVPPPESAACWARAAQLACHFWARMSQTESVSAAFREIATRNAELVGENRHY
jgi:hypothetical protein